MKKILCVVTAPTPGRFREALDFILGVSAFNADTRVLFAGGSLPLLRRLAELAPEGAGERDFVRTLGMLELYDVTRVFYLDAPDRALAAYFDAVKDDGRCAAFVRLARPLDAAGCAALAAECDHFFTL